MSERLYKFIFSNQAEKFVSHRSAPVSKAEVEALLIRAVRKLTRESVDSLDVRPLRGRFKGWFRVRDGDVRIVFLFEEGEIRVVRVDRVDFRGSVYN